MKAHIQYFRYVLRHKWFVFIACLRMRVPLWQALTHDLSKFTPAEWSPYARQFYNSDGSKRKINREDGGLHTRKLDESFNLAWLHHQKHNPHHWQYWVLINDEDGMVALPMPEKYVREMVADWEGAGRAITGKADPTSWYERNWHKMIMHEQTRYDVARIFCQQYEWTKRVGL